MDREHIGAETVGTIFISTDDIMSYEPVEGWWDLVVSNNGDVQVNIELTPCKQTQMTFISGSSAPDVPTVPSGVSESRKGPERGVF